MSVLGTFSDQEAPAGFYIKPLSFKIGLFKSRFLTSSLLLHAPQSLLLPPLGLLDLLVLSALVEVLDHHAHEHVEHEETDDEEEGDEVQQHPGVVVDERLMEGAGGETEQ